MAKIVFPLHGIRTLASWQRGLADVASRNGWRCPLEGWWYGRFTIFQFLTPFARRAKVAWFRNRYTMAIKENQRVISSNGNRRPSVVAHSFGTYILGYALLKYNDIRFDKIILCGSILPRNFPWDELIERGQVNAVRNEIGLEDFWAEGCGWVIPGTGAAGSRGFTRAHEHLIQPEHNLRHDEFFDTAWMEENWMTFLQQSFPEAESTSNSRAAIAIPTGDHPRAAFLISSLLSIGFLFALLLLSTLAFQHVNGIVTPRVVKYQLQDVERREPIEREFELTYTREETTSFARGFGECEFAGEYSKITVNDVRCEGYTFEKSDQTQLEHGIIQLRRDGRLFRAAIQPLTPVDDRKVEKPSLPEYSAAVKNQNVHEAELTFYNQTEYHVSLVLYRWTPETRSGDKTRWVHLAECRPGEQREYKVYDYNSEPYFFIYASILGRPAQFVAHGNLHGPGLPELRIRPDGRTLKADLTTVLQSTNEEGDQP